MTVAYMSACSHILKYPGMRVVTYVMHMTVRVSQLNLETLPLTI
jgi:hypothetical protein